MLPLQSIKNSISRNEPKIQRDTLTALTRSSKHSDNRLVCYWLHTPSVAVSCCTIKINSCLWGIHRKSYNRRSDYSSMTFCPPWELYQLSSADYSAPLLRFCFPTARNDSSPLYPGLPHPIRSTFRLSQPLSDLLLESPWNPISCLKHSWDSPCRVFPLKTASHSHRVWLPFMPGTVSPSANAGLNTAK